MCAAPLLGFSLFYVLVFFLSIIEFCVFFLGIRNPNEFYVCIEELDKVASSEKARRKRSLFRGNS